MIIMIAFTATFSGSEVEWSTNAVDGVQVSALECYQIVVAPEDDGDKSRRSPQLKTSVSSRAARAFHLRHTVLTISSWKVT